VPVAVPVPVTAASGSVVTSENRHVRRVALRQRGIGGAVRLAALAAGRNEKRAKGRQHYESATVV
jgi:hypothetical protein